IRPPSAKPDPKPEELNGDDRLQTKADEEDWEPPVVNSSGVQIPSHTGRGVGGLPRTVPLGAALVRSTSPTKPSSTPAPTSGSSDSEDGVNGNGNEHNNNTPATTGWTISVPLAPAGTGMRYGAALGGRMGSPMTPMGTGRQWGGGTPVCPKCQKTVYFAEQVKAIGKTYHRNCLRCTGCNTSLDSSKLTERDGDPYCKHCYGKRYGPAGSGYALLGKAGG
ncbi:hypothetical protein BDY19DRAFT_954531, partial [Irpex rosettiformis]